MENSPFVNPDTAKENLLSYFEELEIIWANITKGLSEIHKNNIFLCDFHIDNIFIDKELNVSFIDMDGSLIKDSKKQEPILYSQGYIDPKFKESQQYTFEIELYGLGALFFSTLSTYNSYLDKNPGFIDSFLFKLKNEINLPDKFIHIIKSLTNSDSSKRLNLDAILNILSKEAFITDYSISNSISASNKELVSMITTYIVNAADPSQKHLFFTDPKIVNPLNVENGASGVLYALKKINGSVPKKYIEWIKNHNISKETYPPSLYLGLAGIAWSMYTLDEHELSFEIMGLTNNHKLKFKCPDIYTGTAGIGLTNLFFGQRQKTINT